MFAGGNLNGNGRALAAYLTRVKEGERVEVADLRGFVFNDIHNALLSAELQAFEKTNCEYPFFHGYMRAAPGEHLDKAQWLHCIDEYEKSLGFTGQPRAVSFHIDEQSGEMHSHIAWSRIDTEQEKYFAIDPGLYVLKGMEVARELEIELGLRRIGLERDPEYKTNAPTRDELEEARRLKTDLKEIRETIRDCWEHSDNGRSFSAALEQEGLILARGDRRDFVVIDQEGGHHALNKGITGATAAKTRERLSDIDRAELPTVEQAQAHQLEHQIAGLEKAATVEPSAERSELGELRDWEAHEREVAALEARFAAIEAHRRDPRKWVELVAWEITASRGRDEPEVQNEASPVEKPLGPIAGEVHLAFSLTESAQGFTEALQERGLRLARASAEDVTLNARHREGYQQYVKDHPQEAELYGVKEPALIQENDLVVVSLQKDEPRLCFLNERATGENRAEVEKYLATLNQAELPDLEAAAQQIRDAAALEREAGKYQEMELGKSAGEIRLAYTLSHSPQNFIDGLEERGLRFVQIDKRDVEQNQYEREFCAERGWRPPRELEEGQLCAVDRYGSVLLLNMHTTGESEKEVARYIQPYLEKQAELNLELPGACAAYEEIFQAKYRIHDPELNQKQIHELREMRSELQQERRELRAQLAGDELLNEILPTERAAMQERDAAIRDRLADVGITIKEKCLAEPILARSEYAPFRSTEAREMSLESSAEGLAKGAVSAGKELMDVAVGFVDFAVRLFDTVMDFFFASSPLTREQVLERREVAEEKQQKKEIDWKLYAADDAYMRQIDEQGRLERQREAEHTYQMKGRKERGLEFD